MFKLSSPARLLFDIQREEIPSEKHQALAPVRGLVIDAGHGGYDFGITYGSTHFTSWLTLAPNNKVSGGRLLSSRTQPSANRAAAILRIAAMSIGRTRTALGAFYRRLAYRIGKAKAITTTARKLAILVYRCLEGELVYQDPGAAAYDLRHRESVIRGLRKRAAALGFSLVNGQTGEVLEGVS